MTRNESSQMDHEERINDLLDGTLDEQGMADLKRAASADQELARLIIEAYELQRGIDRLGVEAAPRGLRKRLRRIPRQQSAGASRWRWTATLSAAAAAVVLTVVMLQPTGPGPAEVEQARRELAVAFNYIDRISDRAGGHLAGAVGEGFREGLDSGVNEVLSDHMPFTPGQQDTQENGS